MSWIFSTGDLDSSVSQFFDCSATVWARNTNAMEITQLSFEKSSKEQRYCSLNIGVEEKWEGHEKILISNQWRLTTFIKLYNRSGCRLCSPEYSVPQRNQPLLVLLSDRQFLSSPSSGQMGRHYCCIIIFFSFSFFVVLLSSFYIWAYWGSEWLSNIPKFLS